MRNSAHQGRAGNPDGSNAAAVAVLEQALDLLPVLATHEEYCSARVAQVGERYPRQSRASVLVGSNSGRRDSSRSRL